MCQPHTGRLTFEHYILLHTRICPVKMKWCYKKWQSTSLAFKRSKSAIKRPNWISQRGAGPRELYEQRRYVQALHSTSLCNYLRKRTPLSWLHWTFVPQFLIFHLHPCSRRRAFKLLRASVLNTVQWSWIRVMTSRYKLLIRHSNSNPASECSVSADYHFQHSPFRFVDDKRLQI